MDSQQIFELNEEIIELKKQNKELQDKLDESEQFTEIAMTRHLEEDILNKKIIEAIKEHVKGMFYEEHILPILYQEDSSEEE
tara:strand:- start:156 stop:401 length:246 start_codon:yes stop_codon:yes gene_type:complete